MEPVLGQIFNAILGGERAAVPPLVEQALSAGVEPAAILNGAMIAAMQEVGRRFEAGDYYVPEMLIAARAMQAGLAVLKPRLQQADVQPAGRVVAGTVQSDLHDIGKNLVCMMLEGAGFEIRDLGTDVAPQQFVEAVRTWQPDIVALSALLTTTMPSMKNVIAALDEAGLRGQVKVIIGGAPVTDAYARQIGADGYAPDASRAVALAKMLVR